MAASDQISLGIGSPAGIRSFILFGLSANAVADTTTDQAQKPAGRKHRRRYFVEIDGQEFDVNSVEEAEALLNKAKALAEQVVTRERTSIIVKPGLKVPQIRTPNKELVPVIQKAREEIRDLYAELKRDLEIRYLLAKADEEEEEAIIRLLM